MRYSLFVSVLTVAMTWGALPAIAQDEAEIDCQKPQTTLEMTICAGRSERQSDQEMQAVYQKLHHQYQSGDIGPKDYRKKRLKYLMTSQQAWLKHRQAHCTWVASKFDGGSIQPAIGASCYARLNRQRMTELLEDLEEKGD
jgi:uncharacterized protein YecT (DUF1311 family)